MGWFQRTFSNSPEARLERAERYWSNHEYNKVRLELEELSDSRAQDLYNMAVQKLLELNLEEAHARYSSGDIEGAESHLSGQKIGASRQQIKRQIGRSIQAEEQAKRTAAAQRKAASKHFQGEDPIWSLPPDDPRLQYAIHLEGYPAELRERLIPLGQEFAQAVLAIQQGNGQQLVATLSNYIEREPAVRYERARAAMSIGDFSLAISDLMLFGQEVGHQVINNTHTGALLGQLMAQMGK